jgi:YggT family protein
LADVIHAVGLLVQLLAFAIFARAILSWFPIDRAGPVVSAIEAITDPVLEPLRRVIPRFGMIDVSPMVAIITLFIVANILTSY